MNTKTKVLFIDDDEFLIRIVKRFFAYQEQYQLFVANTGKIGRKIAEDKQPHIIILDIVMPNENGWELAEILKKDPNTCKIPIIIASGAGSVYNDNPYIEPKHIDNYLRKPYDMSDLINIINNTIKIPQQLPKL